MRLSRKWEIVRAGAKAEVQRAFILSARLLHLTIRYFVVNPQFPIKCRRLFFATKSLMRTKVDRLACALLRQAG